MLTALEQGVKGGIWFSLIDKVYAPANLFASYAKVAANGSRGRRSRDDVEDFTKRWSRNLRDSAHNCGTTTYRPQACGGYTSPSRARRKRGRWASRRCGIASSKGQLRHVLEPIFERQFAEHSYGFRPDGAAKTRCDGWISCSKQATATSSTSI